MKNRITTIILLLTLALTLGFPAIASVITSAINFGVITITNNSTATANVAAVFTGNTTSWVENGIMNSSGNNMAIRTGSGADVAYMPGYGPDGNPWCLWVPAIGENTNLTDVLYTGGSDNMDGKIRYFPSSTGMNSGDPASMEPGDNFTIEQIGWFNTDYSVNQTYLNKEGAILIWNSAAEDVTSSILSMEDFLTYAETDVNGKLTVTSTKATGEDVDTDEDVYLNKDYGVNHFDALDIDFELFIDSTSQNNAVAGMAIANVDDALDGFAATDLSIVVNFSAANYNIFLRRGAAVASDTYVGAADTPYFCTLTRAAGNDAAQVKIYFDSARTVLLDTLNVAGYGAVKWRYAYGFANWNSGAPNQNFDGYVQNLDLNGGPLAEVTASGVPSGEYTVETTAHSGEYTKLVDVGDTLHFTGAANSNVNAGAIHNAATKFWISLRFKLDANHTAGGTTKYLWGKHLDATHYLHLWLHAGGGTLYFQGNDGGGVYTLQSIQNSWDAGQWYHVILSLSDVNDTRLITDGTVATVADTQLTPNGGDFVIGDKDDPGAGNGFAGVITDFFCEEGVDLTPAEELALYNGIPPATADNIWPLNEGSGLVAIDLGVDTDDGTIDAAPTWTTGTRYTDFYIDADGITGGKDLYGSSVPDNGNDWITSCNATMPYILHQKVTVGGNLVQHIEWEYSDNFTDLTGNSNYSIPSFRGSSSAPNVSASLSSFQPISEAQAPPYTLAEAPAFFTVTPGVTGNFSIGVAPSYPGRGVIVAVAAASSVPEALPTFIFTAFCLIILSLATSYMFKKSGVNSLFIKMCIITAAMCILVAIKIFDVWQVYFFVMIALSLCWLSRQREAY